MTNSKRYLFVCSKVVLKSPSESEGDKDCSLCLYFSSTISMDEVLMKTIMLKILISLNLKLIRRRVERTFYVGLSFFRGENFAPR